MLLDIEMPRIDGFELAALIRNTKENEDLPIIMISSRSGRKHSERASRLGVNRFLGKPYQDNELLNNIESLLDESRVADGSTA
jgi:chemosensory pili system protein ChpA (sensor histidine kinase/response regulator)